VRPNHAGTWIIVLSDDAGEISNDSIIAGPLVPACASLPE